jgi:hypothetical protein
MPAVIVLFGALLIALYILLSGRRAPRAKRFSCPKCGGTSWGSVPPFEHGTCYECGWRWRRAEDAQYFYEP